MAAGDLGRKDRLVRGAVGLGMMVPAAFNVIGPWGWIGIIPVVSAAMGWCPAYMIIGRSTRKG